MTRRRGWLGRLALGACAAVALTGCGLPKSLVFGAPETSVQDAGLPAHANTSMYHVYFVLDGHLFPSGRTDEVTFADGVVDLRPLFEGPSSAERKAGLKSAIPSGLVPRGGYLDKAAQTVTVYLTDDPGKLPALAMAQIACTVTANGFDGDYTVRLYGPTRESREAPRCRLHPGRYRNGDDVTPQVPVTAGGSSTSGSRGPESAVPSAEPGEPGTDGSGG